MRINSLRIQNFRRFEDRTFVFDERFTLLIGTNAAGKTAALDALAVALGAVLMAIPKAVGVSIAQDDVRRTWRRAGETGHYVQHHPVCITANGSVDGNELDWERELKSAKSRTTRVRAKAIRDAMDRLMARSTNEEDVVFPLVGYYGTGRLAREQRLTAQRIGPAKRGLRYAGYRDCLTPTSSVRHMIAWVKRLALIQAEEGRPLQTLVAVYEAVAKTVENAVRAAFDFAEDDIVVEFDDGHRFPLRMLSDGQRSMAATAADIAMRCSQLNPHLNERARTETPGIVLVDELDLHLHPRWQRSVVRDLSDAFPRIQFVATSHSPFIIQSMSRGGVINLDAGEPDPETPSEQSIEDVVENIMGVEQPQRSKRFQELVVVAEKYFDALEGGVAEGDSKDMEDLRTRLDRLEEPFADNPAYVAFLRLERTAKGL